MKLPVARDFYAGLLFVAFGVIAITVRYPMGSTGRIGPGYFPAVLGGILTLLGVAIAGRALLMGGAPLNRVALRPLLLILGGVGAFSLLLERVGLVPSALVLVVMSRLSGSEWRPGEISVLFLVLVLFISGLFVYALGLPIPLWPA